MDKSLTKFLRAYEVKKGDNSTHTSKIDFKAYYIPDEELDKFYKIYAKVISENGIACITEKPTDICPLIIDIDAKLNKNEYDLLMKKNLTKGYDKEFISGIIEIYMNILQKYLNVESSEFYKCYVFEKDAMTQVKERDMYKFGIHLHFPNVFLLKNFQKNVIRKDAMECLEEYIKGYDDAYEKLDINDVLDKSIPFVPWLMYGSRKEVDKEYYKLTSCWCYENNKLFRAEKPNIKTEDDIYNFIKEISVRRDEETYHTLIKEEYMYLLEEPTKDINFGNGEKDQALIDEFLKLKDLINWESYVKTYPDWFDVGARLYELYGGDSDGLEMWKELSKACPAKYDEASCEKKWDKEFQTGKTSPSTFIKQCKYKLFEQNPDKYNDYFLKKSKSKKVKSQEQPKTFQDFTLKYNGKRIGIDCDRTEFIQDLNANYKFIFKNDNDNIIFCKNQDGWVMSKDSGKNNVFNFKWITGKKTTYDKKTGEEQTEDEIKTINLSKFIKNYGGLQLLEKYYNYNFDPTDTAINRKGIFNIFSGFRLKPYEGKVEDDDPAIKPFILHVKEIFANNDEERFKFLMSWFANVFQTKRKNKVAIVLKTDEEQCAGKSLFIGGLFIGIMGQQYIVKNNDMNQFLDKFNGIVDGKLIQLFEEATFSGDKRLIGKLKDKITSDIVVIERKGLEAETKTDYSNLIFTSNNHFPVPITENDNRFAMFECSNKYANCDKKIKEEYFINLADALNDDNKLSKFYRYLLDWDLSDYYLPNKIPKTEFRQDALNNAKNPINIWADEYCKESYANQYMSYDIDDQGDEGDTKSKRTIKVFEEFKNWCHRCGYDNRYTHITGFTRQLKLHKNYEYKNNKSGSWFVIKIEKIDDDEADV
jgi:hypothetical protein